MDPICLFVDRRISIPLKNIPGSFYCSDRSSNASQSGICAGSYMVTPPGEIAGDQTVSN